VNQCFALQLFKSYAYTEGFLVEFVDFFYQTVKIGMKQTNYDYQT